MYIAYSELQSNYRLRGEPVPLKLTVQTSVETPDGGTWENEGGACAPDPEQIVDLWRYRSTPKLKGPRKQRAARAYSPKESIKIVPFQKAPVDHPLTVLMRIEDTGSSKEGEK